ncbi:uncharacterized protein METZ01_LOCUS394764 [marine metagenome]|uniref:Uncharacterized protein n=1 Tax=marine metagenome TaxID=408172 RepID=A0A382V637_9ZZZZ
MKVLYVDMDNVLVNFQSGIDQLPDSTVKEFEGRLDDAPNIFAKMLPVDGAIEAYRTLSRHFDTYILSTAPWENPSAWSDKLNWVKKYLGDYAHKRLILSHHKNLNHGDYLIDDRLKNGVDRFTGEHIHFGSERFRNWDDVLNYLLPKREIG